MQGFRLTSQMKGQGFSGGSVSYGSLGHMFDVGKALEEGDGVILTDNDLFAQVLRQFPALESVPESALPMNGKPVEIASLAATTVVGMPGAVGQNNLPWTPQTSVTTTPVVEVPEIVAEHADEPNTPEEAVKIGEAVSGGTSQSPRSSSPLQSAATN